jgi:hypothetical protein
MLIEHREFLSAAECFRVALQSYQDSEVDVIEFADDPEIVRQNEELTMINRQKLQEAFDGLLNTISEGAKEVKDERLILDNRTAVVAQ